MGLEGLIAARKGVLHGIVNGIDTEVWNPETDPLLPATYSARRLQARAANRAAIEQRFGLDADGSPLLVRRQPADLAEGHGPPRLDHHGRHRRRRAPARRARQRRPGARGAPSTRSPPSIPGRVGFVVGYDEPLVAPDPGRRRRHPDPVALRALRPHPALRPALRLRADRRPRRRPRRHGDRRQRRRARTPASPPASSSPRSTRRPSPPRSAAPPRSSATPPPGRRSSARA